MAKKPVHIHIHDAFEESKHPRSKTGEFGSGGGSASSGGKTAAPAPKKSGAGSNHEEASAEAYRTTQSAHEKSGQEAHKSAEEAHRSAAAHQRKAGNEEKAQAHERLVSHHATEGKAPVKKSEERGHEPKAVTMTEVLKEPAHKKLVENIGKLIVQVHRNPDDKSAVAALRAAKESLREASGYVWRD